MGPTGRSSITGSGGLSSKVVIRCLALLFSLAPSYCEVSSFPNSHPIMMCCLAVSSKATELIDHGLKCSKTLSQNKPFLLKHWLSYIFYYSDRMLTNIMSKCITLNLVHLNLSYILNSVKHSKLEFPVCWKAKLKGPILI